MNSIEQTDDEAIQVEIADGCAVVCINNVPKRNSLTIESARLMVEMFDIVDRDHTIGALVIKGRGATFCSGADLSTLGSTMDDPAGEVAYRGLEDIYSTFTRLRSMSIPTIAAVRGFAVGAGLNLALAADMRIVAEDARLISGFAKNGLLPGGGHFNLISRSSSHEVAAALGIFSQEISGQRAAELGLVWEALPDAQVEERALEIARIAARDPDYSRMAVKTLRLTSSPSIPWDVALQAERAPQIWSFRRQATRR
jgi:enoyl-CoA hydratase